MVNWMWSRIQEAKVCEAVSREAEQEDSPWMWLVYPEQDGTLDWVTGAEVTPRFLSLDFLTVGAVWPAPVAHHALPTPANCIFSSCEPSVAPQVNPSFLTFLLSAAYPQQRKHLTNTDTDDLHSKILCLYLVFPKPIPGILLGTISCLFGQHREEKQKIWV